MQLSIATVNCKLLASGQAVLNRKMSHCYMERSELVRIRELAMALPEMTERLSHGAPTFFIRDKKTLCHFHDDHHGDGRLAIWAPAPPGVQDDLVRLEPDRFFVPPYVGHRGWIGVHLNVDPDWDEIGGILEDAYRLVAPKTLVKKLDEQ